MAAWAGLLCCLLSLLCTIGVSVVDQRYWAGEDGGEDFARMPKPVRNRTGYERVPEIEMAVAGNRSATDVCRGDAGSVSDDGDGSAFRNPDIHVADSSRRDLQFNANLQLRDHSSDEEDIKVVSQTDRRPRDRIRKGDQSDATLAMLADSSSTGRARRLSSPARVSSLSIAGQEPPDVRRGGVQRLAVGSPPLFVLCFLMFVLYGTIIPFNTIHSAFLQSRWYPGDPEKAARVMAIPDTISALFVAPCGTFVDRLGHRMRILLCTGLGIATVHFVLGTATRESLSTPVVPLVVLGFCYANLLTYWACVPLLVHESQVAQAYGMATVSLNLSSTVFPLVVGTLQVADPTFRLVEMFFVGCGIVGALCCLVLRWLDPDGILDMPEVRAVKAAAARWK